MTSNNSVRLIGGNGIVLPMPQKTLMRNQWTSSIREEEAIQMGYDAIQSVDKEFKDSHLSRIDWLSAKQRNSLFVLNVKNTKALSEVEPLQRDFGEQLWVEASVSPEFTLRHIMELYEKTQGVGTFLTFPVSFRQSNKYLGPRKAHDLVRAMRERGHEVEARTDVCAPNVSLPGERYFEFGFSVLADRRDHAQTSEQKLEQAPEQTPQQTNSPEFSLVMPVYNNRQIACHVLKNLAAIYQSDPCFEIIVVDDGSSDGFSEAVLAMEKSLQLPWVLIRNPRNENRKMGDFLYRAGLSRNIGVGFARAENLFFLDCDIMLSPQTFKVLREELKQADVVMCRREHLRPSVSQQLPDYDSISDDQLMVSDLGYWREFYESAGQWNSRADKWKYVCTHSLCLKKELFRSVGGISNNYNVYGYEDVELGFRIAKKGLRFKLSSNVVYHLSPAKERSEFGHVHSQKMKLLSYSSEIFYFNTLDEDVFKHTEIFWGRPNFLHRLHALKKKISSGFNSRRLA